MKIFPLPRLIGWMAVVMLVMAAIGWYEGKFFLLRLAIFGVCCVFIFLTHKGKKHVWVVFFILMALAFNPIYPLQLSLQVWRILDVAAALGLSFFLWNYYDSYGKGYRFEDTLASLFPSYEWVIADKTRDYSKKFERVVESDSNPDFTFRHIRTNKFFSIECKYRSYFYNGGIEFTARQLNNYLNYGSNHNIPVYVALGVGGSPKKPGKLFLIPITSVSNGYKSGFLSVKDLEKFQRNPAAPFTLNSEGELV
jgi:hypothetical protein